MERRSQSEDDMTPMREDVNVFGDEFEVEDFDGVADGFRPGHNHDREGGPRQNDEEEVPIRTLSAHYASTGPTPTGPSRDSTRKSRSRMNPFASPEDEPEPLLSRTPSGNFIARRSTSSTSSHQYAGSDSPRFGGGGPSHPYSMYPQGTVARTPSAATASTARPQRQSSSRYAPAPQHPYALYPQGVGDDIDDEHSNTQNAVPVGFLGLGQAFQRQRGPDGEEQDILGDFGHTEQLPPYSRYPEDGPDKALLGTPRPPSALHSRAPVLGTDPANPLMHTQLQLPQQQSMMDESNLNRQASTMSRASTLQASSGNSPSNSLKLQKSWSEKSWKEKRKTRFCGIPFWLFLVAAGVIVFIVAIIGGVIGGFVEGQKQGHENALAAAAASESLYDASLIVTATTSQPPATGTYALSLGPPQETQAACLHNSNQQAAWDCDLAGNVDLSIVIGTPPGSNQAGASLHSDIINDTLLAYGTQRSNMQTPFTPFLLVKDNDAPDNGPAFYFSQQYDKLVVVPEDALDQPSRTIKRDIPFSSFGQPHYAQPSDKPWFCFWNNTFVEGFIYPREEAVIPVSSNISNASSSSVPSTNGAPLPTPRPSYPGHASPAANPWSVTWASPWETVSTTMTMSSTTCSYTGAASALPSYIQSHYPYWYSHWSDYQQQYENDGPPSDQRKRSEPYEHGDPDNTPQEYPYLVKIEERRLPDSPPSYCRQAQVLDNFHWNWVGAESDDQFTIWLHESDPGYADSNDHDADNARLKRKRWIPGECHCQWQSGQ